MTRKLDDILSEQPADTEPARDEQGRFAAEDEAPLEQVTEQAPGDEEPTDAQDAPPEADSGPPPQPEQDMERVPVAALKDERAKRQKLEQRNAELEAMFAQFQQQQAQPQQPQGQAEVPDMFADPEGYTAFIEQRAAQRAVEQAMEAQRLERVRLTAMAAQQKYPDYNEAIAAFRELAAANPGLEAHMLQQPDPAEWAYRTAKTHMEVSQYGSLDAAVNARVEAELARRMEKLQSEAKATPPIPRSLASERSVASRTNAVPWNGPKPIGDILP